MNKNQLTFAAAALLLVLCCDFMAGIQQGSYDAIMDSTECREIYGLQVWYFPNGKISLVRWCSPSFNEGQELKEKLNSLPFLDYDAEGEIDFPRDENDSATTKKRKTYEKR